MKQYRQGDVFVEVVKKPKGFDAFKILPRDKGRIVLAYGEVTGHAHAILDAGAFLREGPDGTLYLDLKTEVAQVHEEHGPVVYPLLTPNLTYRVTRQREYMPAGLRVVGD
jgi:hypothetical protein